MVTSVTSGTRRRRKRACQGCEVQIPPCRRLLQWQIFTADDVVLVSAIVPPPRAQSRCCMLCLQIAALAAGLKRKMQRASQVRSQLSCTRKRKLGCVNWITLSQVVERQRTVPHEIDWKGRSNKRKCVRSNRAPAPCWRCSISGCRVTRRRQPIRPQAYSMIETFAEGTVPEKAGVQFRKPGASCPVRVTYSE